MRRWMLLSVVLIGLVMFASAETGETDESTEALKSGESVTKALGTVTSSLRFVMRPERAMFIDMDLIFLLFRLVFIIVGIVCRRLAAVMVNG